MRLMFSIENPSSLLMVAGLALAVAILVRWRRAIRRKSIEQPTGLSVERQVSALPAYPPRELDRWHVEMHDAARELRAEIDTKLAALQAVTIAARHERERLEATIAQATQVEFNGQRT
ncbi:MAG: hypothetical protein WD872_08515 [Pirellulaceae bacterium]